MSSDIYRPQRRLMKPLQHFSSSPIDPFYFYGGWPSSFAQYPFDACSMDRPRDLAMTFATREHWFAAHKTLSPSDFAMIVAAPTARRAKELGRSVDLRVGWDDGIAYVVMLLGIRAQLRTHEELRQKLLATHSRIIAEDSKTDFIWGIRDPDGELGGRNLLGRAWMQARIELMAGDGLDFVKDARHNGCHA